MAASQQQHREPWGHKVTFVAYVVGPPDGDAIHRATESVDGYLGASMVGVSTVPQSHEPHDQVGA